jgi:hypothetical protein
MHHRSLICRLENQQNFPRESISTILDELNGSDSRHRGIWEFREDGVQTSEIA